jgi:uncharacterized protein involved in exopolysaccharide biosynthesis
MFNHHLVDSNDVSGDSPRPGSPRGSSPLDGRRMLRAINEGRRWVLVSALAGGVLGAIAVKVAISPRYKTAATVVRDTALQGSALDAVRSGRSVTDSVKMPANLAEVRKRLSLPMTLEDLAAKVEVTATTDSSVISIQTSADDAQRSLLLTNTVVAVFLESREGVERARLRDLIAASNTDRQAAQGSLRAVQGTYAAFREKNEIVDFAAERQALVEQAIHLRAEAGLAEVEARSEEAKAKSLLVARSKEPQSVTVAQRVSVPAAVQLAATQAELASVKSRLSADHPTRMLLEARSVALRGELANPGSSAVVERTTQLNPAWAEAHRSQAGAAALQAGAWGRREALGELAANARNEVNRMDSLAAEATELMRQVKSAEGHLNELESRHLSLEESLRAPSAGFRVAAAAAPPDMPERSLRRPLALVFPLAAAILAALGLMARAARGLRVHTATEAAYWLGAPVLASTRWRGGPGSEDVTDAVVALVPDRDVNVLVVAAGPADVACADQLSESIEATAPGACVARRVGDQATSVLRHAARAADCVLVVVASGTQSGPRLRALSAALGRTDGVGAVLTSLPASLELSADRIGDAGRFSATSDGPRAARHSHA